MSWRFLLFWAAVVVVLYGAADVVYSSGSPRHLPGGATSNPRATDQELIETASPDPLTREELAACPTPTDASEGSVYACAITFGAVP